MFHSYIKIEGQKKKIKLWITRIENNCFEMFSILMEFMSGVNENNEDYIITRLKLIIVNHLNMLSLKFEEYFPSNQDLRDGFLWILDSYSANSSTNTLSMNEEDMLADLSSDVTLKNLKNNSSLNKFWIEAHSEYEAVQLRKSTLAGSLLTDSADVYSISSGFVTFLLGDVDCLKSPRCSKCGDNHYTVNCTKSPSEPSKYALYSGPHTASYKGCQVFKKLNDNLRKSHLHEPYRHSTLNHTIPSINKLTFSSNQNQKRSYANVTANTSPSTVTPESLISKFLEEFKTIINPLLLILTTVVDHLLPSSLPIPSP
ncbi:hypothetical protein QTP88_009404 [Uroleucon formosanum]